MKDVFDKLLQLYNVVFKKRALTKVGTYAAIAGVTVVAGDKLIALIGRKWLEKKLEIAIPDPDWEGWVLLAVGISSICLDHYLRRDEERGKRNALRHNRDARHLKNFFGAIDLYAFAIFFERAAYRSFQGTIIWHYEMLNALVSSPSFQPSDKKVDRLTRALTESLGQALSQDEFTHVTTSDLIILRKPVQQSSEVAANWQEALMNFDKGVSVAESSLRALIKYTNHHYPEVDTEELSEKARASRLADIEAD